MPTDDDRTTPTIASVVVQARQHEHERLSERISALSGASVHATGTAGRMAVVIETGTDADLVRRIDEIGALPGVLGVNLVFHHSERHADSVRAARHSRMQHTRE